MYLNRTESDRTNAWLNGEKQNNNFWLVSVTAAEQ